MTFTIFPAFPTPPRPKLCHSTMQWWWWWWHWRCGGGVWQHHRKTTTSLPFEKSFSIFFMLIIWKMRGKMIILFIIFCNFYIFSQIYSICMKNFVFPFVFGIISIYYPRDGITSWMCGLRKRQTHTQSYDHWSFNPGRIIHS